eukprot:gene12652-biopygen16952
MRTSYTSDHMWCPLGSIVLCHNQNAVRRPTPVSQDGTQLPNPWPGRVRTQCLTSRHRREHQRRARRKYTVPEWYTEGPFSRHGNYSSREAVGRGEGTDSRYAAVAYLPECKMLATTVVDEDGAAAADDDDDGGDDDVGGVHDCDDDDDDDEEEEEEEEEQEEEEEEEP